MGHARLTDRPGQSRGDPEKTPSGGFDYGKSEDPGPCGGGQEGLHKELQAARQDAKQAWDNLNNIPTPVMAIDKDFKITYMNPAGAGVAGKTPKTCVGLKCFGPFSTLHCNTPDCQAGKAMHEDAVCTDDTAARLPSGELPIRYTGAPLKDADGNITGALEYVLDITSEIQSLNGVPELVEAAVQGNLGGRGHAEKLEGNFQKIVHGFNDTLDAVVQPLDEATAMLEKMADDDLATRVTAAVYVGATLGAVLTGMGSDGTRGAGLIKAAGGEVIAQDEVSSVLYEMPKSVAEAGHVDSILPLPRMASEIVRRCRTRRRR